VERATETMEKKGVIVGGNENEVEEQYGSIFGGHENVAGEYVTILGDWCGKVKCKGKCKDTKQIMDVESVRNITIIDDNNSLTDSHFQCIKNKKKPYLKDICEFYPMMYTLTNTKTKSNSTKTAVNDFEMDD